MTNGTFLGLQTCKALLRRPLTARRRAHTLHTCMIHLRAQIRCTSTVQGVSVTNGAHAHIISCRQNTTENETHVPGEREQESRYALSGGWQSKVSPRELHYGERRKNGGRRNRVCMDASFLVLSWWVV
jgi:hypothetical protein